MMTNCNIIMMSQTLSLNIAITNGKQPNNRLLQKIVEYTREELSRAFQIKKAAKSSKAVTFKLKHSKYS